MAQEKEKEKVEVGIFDCPNCGSDEIAEKRLYFNEEMTAVELVEYCCDCGEILHDNIWWEPSDICYEVMVH